MRYLTLCSALLVGFAASANADDISTDSFAAIGLADMNAMTADQGMDIRAKGLVWGQSTATSLTHNGFATSTNGYLGKTQYGDNGIFGANFSIADASVGGGHNGGHNGGHPTYNGGGHGGGGHGGGGYGAPTSVAGGFSFVVGF